MVMGEVDREKAWAKLVIWCWTHHIWAVSGTGPWRFLVADGRNSYLPGAGLGENSRKSADICIKSTRPSHKVTGCWKEENDGILPRGASVYKVRKARGNHGRSSNWRWLREEKSICGVFPLWHFPTIHGTAHRLIISMGEGMFLWQWHSMAFWINLQTLKSELLGSLMFLYKLNGWSISGI